MSGGGGGGCPMWVLTYADMITVLMGFFVIMSTMNKPEKKEEFAAELVERFGSAEAMQRYIEATLQRNETKDKLTMQPKKGRIGQDPRVMTIREGNRNTVGGPVYFDTGSMVLDKPMQEHLQAIADSLRGKWHIVEVKAYRPNPSSTLHARDPAEVAMERALAVEKYLIQQGGLHPEVIRLEVAAPLEAESLPLSAGDHHAKDRVDVLLLESSRREYGVDNKKK